MVLLGYYFHSTLPSYWVSSLKVHFLKGHILLNNKCLPIRQPLQTTTRLLPRLFRSGKDVPDSEAHRNLIFPSIKTETFFYSITSIYL